MDHKLTAASIERCSNGGVVATYCPGEVAISTSPSRSPGFEAMGYRIAVIRVVVILPFDRRHCILARIAQRVRRDGRGHRAVTFGFGGWTWGLLLVLFFVTSSALSRYREADKRKAAEPSEKGSRRDLAQVLANGGVPAGLALANSLAPWEGWLAMFIGGLATVTADTWATELGSLSRSPPRLVTTGRLVAAGTSGGISVPGTLAAVAGAATIGLAAGLMPNGLLWSTALSLGLVSGLAGSLIDSLLGASLQRQGYCPSCQTATEARIHRCGVASNITRGCSWLGNDAVNCLASLAGGIIALVFWLCLTGIGA